MHREAHDVAEYEVGHLHRRPVVDAELEELLERAAGALRVQQPQTEQPGQLPPGYLAGPVVLNELVDHYSLLAGVEDVQDPLSSETRSEQEQAELKLAVLPGPEVGEEDGICFEIGP